MEPRFDRPPTPAELQILEALWRDGPGTVRGVWESLGRKTSYTSVLKTMQVMAEKRLLRRDESAMTHVYRPAVERAENQRRMLDDLLARAFSGSASELVQRALASPAVSADELKRIQRIIAKARKERGESA